MCISYLYMQMEWWPLRGIDLWRPGKIQTGRIFTEHDLYRKWIGHKYVYREKNWSQFQFYEMGQCMNADFNRWFKRMNVRLNWYLKVNDWSNDSWVSIARLKSYYCIFFLLIMRIFLSDIFAGVIKIIFYKHFNF